MSRATNDTISVHSSEPEKEAEDVNPFGDPVLRAARERLQAKGPEYIEQLRREVIGQPVPDLPERLRRGPRLEASSPSAAASSSTVPKAQPTSGSGVRSEKRGTFFGSNLNIKSSFNPLTDNRLWTIHRL